MDKFLKKYKPITRFNNNVPILPSLLISKYKWYDDLVEWGEKNGYGMPKKKGKGKTKIVNK